MAPTPSFFLKSQSALTNINLTIDGAQTVSNLVDVELQADTVTSLTSFILKVSITDVNESQSVTQQIKSILGV
jgi:ribose 5-phosphate isomerase